MPSAFKLPSALARQTRFERLGPTRAPALLAHPDWTSPAPTVIWLHGRTVTKELDNGRYLRWIRAGIAACAIDLPGHGEREGPRLHGPTTTLDLLSQAIPEVDHIVAALADPRWNGAFDTSRLALGGMSAGGMIALRRLCDDHPFVCAAVEGTAGNLSLLYTGSNSRVASHAPDRIAALDPMRHLDTWRPIPLLALHSESDQVVPVAAIRTFIEALRDRYRAQGADPAQIDLTTWPTTGAPEEHSGFGLAANDAKNKQLEFLARCLQPTPPSPS
jgi:alpha-beta hydrolase superfamily lysophospholipase